MIARRRHVGVILSAGGSSFFEASKIAEDLPFDFFVVTDRVCEAISRCHQASFPVHRIESADNREFSSAARIFFEAARVEFIVLFFSRLITSELFDFIPCYNVHPSLLPAFPGLSAVKKAWLSRARFIGATMHSVDATIDGGRIFAQTVIPIPIYSELKWCERASFLQKTLLMLVLLDLVNRGDFSVISPHAFELKEQINSCLTTNPSLLSPGLIKSFVALQKSFGIEVFS